MSYISLSYYGLVLAVLLLYYCMPKKVRWTALLLSSAIFYYFASGSKKQCLLLACSIAISYCAGRGIAHVKKSDKSVILKRVSLWIGILLSALPLIAERVFRIVFSFGKTAEEYLEGNAAAANPWSFLFALGISFYSLQMIAYLVDIYQEKIVPQKNIFKYALFISFFPQIVQGPIPRYDKLQDQLVEGHDFSAENFIEGLQLLMWGFFLKYMIADKAGIIVDAIFRVGQSYAGAYIWIAGFLYSMQLYTDFLACVTMSQGTAQLFGISLTDNFARPYFAKNVKDFWRRWHISLSSWLRDYVYIPLGGNRKGSCRRKLNLLITFVVSGLWHGSGLHFLVWGILHGVYQIVGEKTGNLQNKITSTLFGKSDAILCRCAQQAGTFFWVMLAWILFRAENLALGIKMIRNMFSAWNPWVIWNGEIFGRFLSRAESEVLGISIFILLGVSILQEKGIRIRDWVNKQHLIIRWGIYLCAICSIWVFGSYGYGFDSKEFIYGGF